MKCADSPLSTVCWREERILLVLELAVEGFTRRVKGLLTRCCPLSLRRREYDPATVAEKEAEKSPPVSFLTTPVIKGADCPGARSV